MGLTLILSALMACGAPADKAPSEDTPAVTDPGDTTPDSTGPEAPPDFAVISDTDRLIRASVDLRGVRPTPGELEAVRADPDALEGLVDEYLHDERFGAQVRTLFNYVYLTRVETWAVAAYYFGVGDQIGEFTEATGQEPLRVLSTIAEEDLHYSQIVTADWTMANELIAEGWPVDYPEGESGWRQVHYTDGRPMAGVLSSNAMWWRYTSTLSNANRGRANAASRILLCNDYLGREIEFNRDVDLLDEAAVAEAITTDPGCAACHASLEPLSAYFWGFTHLLDGSTYEMSVYHAEREGWWSLYTDIGPGYYGQPGYDLIDLGRQMAQDPRLYSCAVENVYEGLLQRDSDLEDFTPMDAHLGAFEDGGYTLRALIRSVVLSDEYRADAPKLMLPDQLVSQVQDITGYKLTYFGFDLFQSDLFGLQTLAGGADGVTVLEPARTPNATMLLAQERLAEASSWFAVERDAAGSPELLTDIDFTETPDGDGAERMVAQLQALHLRVLGHDVDADGPEVAANLDLWRALYDVEQDPLAAWAGVLSVLLRDPDFILY